MSKKYKNFSADNIGKKEAEIPQENNFYFGKENYKLMLIGLVLIVVGFLLMMGPRRKYRRWKIRPKSLERGNFLYPQNPYCAAFSYRRFRRGSLRHLEAQ